MLQTVTQNQENTYKNTNMTLPDQSNIYSTNDNLRIDSIPNLQNDASNSLKA